MAPQRRALATTAAAFVIIVAAVAGGLGAYAITNTHPSLSGSQQNQSSTCEQYSCIYIHVDSNSSVSGITTSISPAPAACAHGPPYCTPVGLTECSASSNFCTSTNTQAKTASFAFQGVKQGYYWLDFEANLGNNATTGKIRIIHVLSDTSYCVTANITAGLATADISITNSTSNSTSSMGADVMSAKLVGPYAPAGPTVELTFQNQWGCCVTSLSAILVLNNNYTFYFEDVNSSHPLDQGQTVTVTKTLIGAGFDSSRSYPLVVKGTTQDTIFTDTIRIQIPQ